MRGKPDEKADGAARLNRVNVESGRGRQTGTNGVQHRRNATMAVGTEMSLDPQLQGDGP
jgi:hypothetical protein